PLALTGPRESIARCAIAVEGNGDVWVCYSAFRGGQHHIYARRISMKPGPGGKAAVAPRPGPEQQVTAGGSGPELSPGMVTGQDGRVFLIFQAINQGRLGTSTRVFRDGKVE